jgi:galactokinase
LNRSWEAKQRTAHGISTDRIEELRDIAFANGAVGGKVSGAGGGGFMMFIMPPHRRIAVVRTLNAAGGNASGVHLTSRGAESWSVSSHISLTRIAERPYADAIVCETAAGAFPLKVEALRDPPSPDPSVGNLH